MAAHLGTRVTWWLVTVETEPMRAPSPAPSLPKEFIGKPANNDHEKRC